MQNNQLSKILYHKTDEEPSERTILPFSVPAKVIRAVDVTDLTEEQQEELRELYERYEKYRKRHLEALFNFADWIEHSGLDTEVDTSDLKYRSFALTKIEEVD